MFLAVRELSVVMARPLCQLSLGTVILTHLKPQHHPAPLQVQSAQLGGLPAAREPAMPQAPPLIVLVNLDNVNKNGNQLAK